MSEFGLAAVFTDSFGDPVEVDLFAGFLAGVGSCLAQRGASGVLVASFTDRFPIAVPVAPAEVTTGLDDAIAAALPSGSLSEALEAVTAAARGRLVDDEGERVVLRSVKLQRASAEASR
jgi:hypothetical protein